MPSLRRTFSAPARSSPYSSSTETRTGSRSLRRLSGSETANRRILADIDWWRVEEGQRQVRGLSPHDQLRPTPSVFSELRILSELSNIVGLKSQSLLRKITTYGGVSAVANAVLLWLLLRQIPLSRSAAGLSRVSRYPFIIQSLIDAVSFVDITADVLFFHVTTAILSEGLPSIAVLAPAGLACVLFVYEAVSDVYPLVQLDAQSPLQQFAVLIAQPPRPTPAPSQPPSAAGVPPSQPVALPAPATNRPFPTSVTPPSRIALIACHVPTHETILRLECRGV
ncbi:hypothetical protein BC835DRAFT_1455346 [Cytidiella melzeri]|nr:hypothetical protein BC835DRAFT_1455346 [Cytidiella melzeri]